ncbi:hypothetical protein ACHAXR_001862 [Thalassiosira sp. AJA248-18]
MASASVQNRLNNAILAHEHAEVEVERLCDILERAADALNKARQTKRAAQKELDEAAKAANAEAAMGKQQQQQQAEGRSAAAGPLANRRYLVGEDQGGARHHVSNTAGQGYRQEEAEQYEDEAEYSEEGSEEYSSEESEEEEDDEDEEEDGFDMGNDALEQVRYRLEIAKINPNSPEGTKLLDELLIRLQNAKDSVIDADTVNEYIDELLFETEEQATLKISNGAAASAAAQNDSKLPQNPKRHQQHPRIRISRGGKVLGWYQGQLDTRGYAREGSGSMYYDAGHECHGTWQNDEMIGRGIYQWSDGHVYDGDWLNGKRHGLGRFIRPDNVVLYGRYEKGHHKGEGVRWSADRKNAQVVVDGVPKKTVGLAKAKEIVANLGFDDALPPV